MVQEVGAKAPFRQAAKSGLAFRTHPMKGPEGNARISAAVLIWIEDFHGDEKILMCYMIFYEIFGSLFHANQKSFVS